MYVDSVSPSLPLPLPSPLSLTGLERFEISIPGPCSTTPALPGLFTAAAHPSDHTVSTRNYSALSYSSEEHIYTHLLCELAHGYEHYIPRNLLSGLGGIEHTGEMAPFV